MVARAPRSPTANAAPRPLAPSAARSRVIFAARRDRRRRPSRHLSRRHRYCRGTRRRVSSERSPAARTWRGEALYITGQQYKDATSTEVQRSPRTNTWRTTMSRRIQYRGCHAVAVECLSDDDYTGLSRQFYETCHQRSRCPHAHSPPSLRQEIAYLGPGRRRTEPCRVYGVRSLELGPPLIRRSSEGTPAQSSPEGCRQERDALTGGEGERYHAFAIVVGDWCDRIEACVESFLPEQGLQPMTHTPLAMTQDELRGYVDVYSDAAASVPRHIE